jgi:hypothetical protein
MSIFRRLFGKKDDSEAPQSHESQQAVLVYLNGTSLPDKVYQEYDLLTIEDRLIEVIEREGLGEFDGNEIGPTETTLFIYGPDAELLFSGIEQTLRDYPLCQGAHVVIRRGGPGSEERVVRL